MVEMKIGRIYCINFLKWVKKKNSAVEIFVFLLLSACTNKTPQQARLCDFKKVQKQINSQLTIIIVQIFL